MKIPLKVAGVALASILGCGLLSCLVEEDSENTLAGTSSSATTTASGSSFSSSQSIYVDLTNGKVSEDNATWSAISTTKTKLLNESVKVDYTKDESGNSTGLVRINLTDTEQNTAVHLSGTMTTGGVKIQTSTVYEAGIYLNGVSITSSSYPCIDITKGGSASVFLVDGTENSLVDGRSYGTGYGEEYSTTSGSTYTDDDGETVSCTVVKAAVSPGSDSKGTLYCKGSMSISGNGSLSIEQGYKNCIASKDGILTIESGTYDLKNYTESSSGKNGLFGGKGIVVDGGSISFSGQGKVSTSELRKANAFKTDDDSYSSSYVKINGGTVSATTYNGKGIAAPVVQITGGENRFTVTGVTGYTSDDNKTGSYYDADGVKCSGSITFAPEGIEGDTSVKISGGSTIISAENDDGINAGSSIAVSGGFVYVKSKGDGIDSNGTVSVSGGVMAVCTYANDNSPIDFDSSFKVTGGKILAVGTDQMGEMSKVTSSVNLLNYTSCGGSANTYFAINNSSGENVVAVKAPYAYSTALYIDGTLSGSYTACKSATVEGNEYAEGTEFYLPAASASGTTISTKTASTSSSSTSSSNTPGSSSGPGSRH